MTHDDPILDCRRAGSGSCQKDSVGTLRTYIEADQGAYAGRRPGGGLVERPPSRSTTSRGRRGARPRSTGRRSRASRRSAHPPARTTPMGDAGASTPVPRARRRPTVPVTQRGERARHDRRRRRRPRTDRARSRVPSTCVLRRRPRRIQAELERDPGQTAAHEQPREPGRLRRHAERRGRDRDRPQTSDAWQAGPARARVAAARRPACGPTSGRARGGVRAAARVGSGGASVASSWICTATENARLAAISRQSGRRDVSWRSPTQCPLRVGPPDPAVEADLLARDLYGDTSVRGGRNGS